MSIDNVMGRALDLARHELGNYKRAGDKQPKLGFCRPDEEKLQVFFGGEELGSVNHDSVGWCGMEAVETLLTRFAEKLGIEIEELEPQEAE